MVNAEELVELTLAQDGTISPAWAAKIAAQLHNDRGATRGEVKEFIAPLTLMLLTLNDSENDFATRFTAAKEAAPYFHRKVPDRPLNLNLGSCNTAAKILKAQRLVIAAMGRGEIVPAEGRQLIEALAVMVRTLEATTLEQQLQAEEEAAPPLSPAAARQRRPSLVVINEDKAS
jgi:hypothetical protein